MADLVALEPEPLGENVIATLERALELARAGELSSVAIALVHRDGCAQALWSDAANMLLLIGSVGRLGHKLNLDLDN